VSVHHECRRLQARALLALGAERSAAAVFDRLLHAAPDDVHALASRAHLHARRGRDAAAIADLQRRVALRPDARAADWFNLAFLLERCGCDAQAEQAFRRATALDANLDRAWYGLGLVLTRMGRFDEAVQALQRNTALQPMNVHGWRELARAHLARGAHDMALAVVQHLEAFEPRAAAALRREIGSTA
jgi:tetratricopeptide (TPR) repeat protein